MPNTNIVVLEGHLGKKPEAKEFKGGVISCNFTVATSMGKGEKAKTQWHNCQIWGSDATNLALNADKGDVVSLKGRIEYREYNGKWYTEIKVDHLHLTKKSSKGGRDEFVAE
jgi:single-strand DNA-binding protein